MLSYRDQRLFIEDISVTTLAERLETPFFLVNERRLRENYEDLCKGLNLAGQDAIVRYCVKTNNESGVLSILAGYDGHVMVSHPAEVQLAKLAGFSSERMAYQSPVLLEEEIHHVMDEGVTLFHAFRLEDLQVLGRVASARSQVVTLSLRLRHDPLLGRLSPIGFLSRRLGLRWDGIIQAAKSIHESRWLSLTGINVYIGTQQHSVRTYDASLSRVVALAVQLQTRWGIRLQEINLGGGIPSDSLMKIGLNPVTLWRRFTDSFSASDSPAELVSYSQALSGEYHTQITQSGLDPPPTLVVESGRSIVGNATILVTRVRAVQDNWVFLDASRNDLGESPLLFIRRLRPVLCPDVNTIYRFYHLSGRTLNTRDILDFRRRLPVLKPGDLLVICDAGAYSISRASRYAGLTPAVHLLQSDGTVRQTRRAENLSDLTQSMIF